MRQLGNKVPSACENYQLKSDKVPDPVKTELIIPPGMYERTRISVKDFRQGFRQGMQLLPRETHFRQAPWCEKTTRIVATLDGLAQLGEHLKIPGFRGEH
jgi:hypothetical protein